MTRLLAKRLFKEQLHNLIKEHEAISYKEVWDFFHSEFEGKGGCAPGTIRGVYEDFCWEPAKQCGIARQQGDCFSREHSWPKSWWNGSQNEAYTDLFHLYPADQYTNGMRNNYPLGPVVNVTYTSYGGAQKGRCSAPGAPSGVCFLPPERVRGNFARSYFYIATAYRFDCCKESGVNGSYIEPWMLHVLLKWHVEDPVDADEMEKNDAIYQYYQFNRNPFIDFPEIAHKIFT